MSSPVKMADRLKSLKERNSNPSVSSNPTSIHTFVALYTKARQDCYTDYMEGTKALISYLAPIVIPQSLLDRVNRVNPETRLPAYLVGYETTELAKLISKYESNRDLTKVRTMERVLIFAALDNIGVTC